MVDKEGYELCKKYKWRISKKGYAKATEIGMMHRYITSCPPDKEVHHIDFKKLNNQKNNLQVVTRSEHVEIHKKLDPKREKLERKQITQQGSDITCTREEHVTIHREVCNKPRKKS